MTLGPRLPVYPGDTPFVRQEVRSIEAGDVLNLSEIRMGAHSGTHVDAPCHFLPRGEAVHELPADAFSGPATVLDLTHVEESITREDIDTTVLGPGDIALMRTKNSDMLYGTFQRDFVYLSEEGARRLLDAGVKAVGIDYLSIEGYGVEGFPVHNLLLSSGVGIIEGLDLSQVGPGRYWLICLPLKVEGGDGAPARAVLVKR
jgi:arylformamidase